VADGWAATHAYRVPRALVELARVVEHLLAGAFAAGGNDPAAPVVSPATLPGGEVPFASVAHVRWPDFPGPPVHPVGVTARHLPDGHPARAALDAGPLYAGTLLVLGPSGLRWYEVGEAAALTRTAEGNRREEEAVEQRRRAERERRDEEARRAWQASQPGNAALERRVAELEAEVRRARE
jgi:hypothetical protein